MRTDIGMAWAAYRLPANYVTMDQLIAEEREHVERVTESISDLSKAKSFSLNHIDGVHRFQGEEAGFLATEAIEECLHTRGVCELDVSLLIDFSTISRDENGISLCYRIQENIGAKNATTLCLGNGSCASFQLALKTAIAFMTAEPEWRFAILFAEDRVRGYRINPMVNVFGDGASAVLLEKQCAGNRLVETRFISIGNLSHVLGVKPWEADNFNINEFIHRVVPLHYYMIKDLVNAIMRSNKLDLCQIDHLMYQNMSRNDYNGIRVILNLNDKVLFQDGLKGHGHIFASDLVINLCCAQAQGKISRKDKVLLVSSGAGYSWSVTLMIV